MRRTTTLLLSTLLALSSFLLGCSETVRHYQFADHQIRIDESEGAENARIFVDECPVEGMYYDRLSRQWGVQGYTYGASYWELDVLAEDMASSGAARCISSTSGGLALR